VAEVSEAGKSPVNDPIYWLCSSRPAHLNTDAVIVTALLARAALSAHQRDTRPLPLET
jgi:hypothetical protein